MSPTILNPPSHLSPHPILGCPRAPTLDALLHASNMYWSSILHKVMYCKEIQPVHSEGDQPWDFFGRNDAKAETPVLWPPHAKS